MSNTITVRVEPDLAAWLEKAAEDSGVSKGEFVREHLRRAKESDGGGKSYMRLAGIVKGLPRNLSQRKGFSRE
jgi:hypothetical protein